MEKILLITGASSDVGIELYKSVYQNYDLILLQYHRMNEALENLVKIYGQKVPTKCICADFSNVDSVGKMVEDIKESGNIPTSIVHLPAPKAYNKQFHKDSWENYENGWKISVHSIVSILQAFIPQMLKQHYGRIVLMLTSCTKNSPAKFQSSYVTVKYALLGLMKALSVEYAVKGITVNGVSPDMMETKFLSNIPELIIEQNRENSPIGRNIRINEVIPIIAYMLSDAGAAMTGENIGIMGGL